MKDGAMSGPERRVVVIDDDGPFRESLSRFLRSAGFSVTAFGSAQEFLFWTPGPEPTCVLVDLWMPGMSGLELQEMLGSIGRNHSLVFLTAHGTVQVSVQAMKGGAVDFIEKPFEEARVLDVVERALARDVETRVGQAAREEARHRYRKLTPRERQVCELVLTGMLNREIAAQIGTTESTVKVHRSRMMEKLGTGSVPDLVRLIDRMNR